jgi:hypothetical protein
MLSEVRISRKKWFELGKLWQVAVVLMLICLWHLGTFQGSVFAQQAGSDETSQEERVESSPAVALSDKQIADLINQLGDKSFEVREAATVKLQQSGEAAIPALREAVKSKDREIRLRAERLLTAVEEQLRKTVIAKFLRETNPDLDYGMKGWKFVAKNVGASRKAKELFLQVYQSHPKLIAALEESVQATMAEVGNVAGQVSANIVAGVEPSVGDAAALLLAMYLPDVQSSAPVQDAIRWATFSGAFKRQMLIETGTTPGRRIFGHWLTVVNEPNSSRALLIGREAMIPESVILGRKMLAGPIDDGDSEIAISMLMLFGDKSDIPLLEGLLKDETEMERVEIAIGPALDPLGAERIFPPNALPGLTPEDEPTPQDDEPEVPPKKQPPEKEQDKEQEKEQDKPKEKDNEPAEDEPEPEEPGLGLPVPLPPPGAPRGLPQGRMQRDPQANFRSEVYVAQKRDLALAALIYLTGQDLRPYFPLMGPSVQRGISSREVAFPESNPKVRAKAFKAWEELKPIYLESSRK